MPLRKAIGACILLLLSISFLIVLIVVPFPVKKQIRFDLPVPDTTTHVVLFAGFPGCRTICPTALDTLAAAYEGMAASPARLRVLFVDLEGLVPPEAVRTYATHFHPAFLAWQPTAQERSRLVQALSIYYAPALPDYRKAVQHSGTLYLLIKEQDRWYLRHHRFGSWSAADVRALFNYLPSS